MQFGERPRGMGNCHPSSSSSSEEEVALWALDFSEVSTWLRKSKPVGRTVLQDTGFRLVLFFKLYKKKKKVPWSQG